MAVIFKRRATDSETKHLQFAGILAEGELTATDEVEELLADLNLQAENAEERLAKSYNNQYINAHRVENDDIDIEALRAELD